MTVALKKPREARVVLHEAPEGRMGSAAVGRAPGRMETGGDRMTCPKCFGTGRYSVWRSLYSRRISECDLCGGSGFAETGAGDA